MSDSGKQESASSKASYQGGASTGNTALTGPNFDSMYEHKRPTDSASTARRESIAEQRPPGSLGQAFKNLVSGSGGSNTSGK